MTSMKVLHDILLQRLWYDWSVMQHDNWSNRDKTVSVWVELNNPLVPGVSVIRDTISDGLMEQFVVFTGETCSFQLVPRYDVRLCFSCKWTVN